jgi:hypothetical protein
MGIKYIPIYRQQIFEKKLIIQRLILPEGINKLARYKFQKLQVYNSLTV